jgi:hypothetical protein
VVGLLRSGKVAVQLLPIEKQLRCIRGVIFAIARCIRVGTVSLGTSQRPQRHLCQPATFLAPDAAIIPMCVSEASTAIFYHWEGAVGR